MKRKKILIHCQYVYGIGHFVRTSELANALCEECEVSIIIGGERIKDFYVDPRIELIYIPAIYKDELVEELIPVDRSLNLEQCLQIRSSLIQEFVWRIIPDIIITEHFPFGFLFKKEAEFLLKEVKKVNTRAKIVCSVRDVIENSSGNVTDSNTVSILNELYDLLLVHGDESIISIKDSFSKFEKITIPIKHTGYISKHITKSAKKTEKKLVVVSIGAGRLGDELLEIIYKCVEHLDSKRYKFILFRGAFKGSVSENFYLSVENRFKNFQILPFDRDLYLNYLSSCDLAISLGGYNSILETVSLGKRLLVYDREFFGNNKEQHIRIKTFSDFKLLDIFNSKILPEAMARLIQETISREYCPIKVPNLNGSINSLEILSELITWDR